MSEFRGFPRFGHPNVGYVINNRPMPCHNVVMPPNSARPPYHYSFRQFENNVSIAPNFPNMHTNINTDVPSARTTARPKRSRWDNDVTPTNQIVEASPTINLQNTKKLQTFAEDFRSPCHHSSSTHKMAIVPTNYPKNKLVQADVIAIESKILQRIDGTPNGNQLPRLRGFDLISGALVYSCDNSDSCEWLHQVLNGCEIDNCKLKVMEEENLPKHVIVSFHTQDTMTTDSTKLLNRLKKYNPSFNVDEWTIIKKSINTFSQHLVFRIDNDSFEAIEKDDFKAYTGVDQGSFKVLKNPNIKKGFSTSESPTTTSFSMHSESHSNTDQLDLKPRYFQIDTKSFSDQ